MVGIGMRAGGGWRVAGLLAATALVAPPALAQTANLTVSNVNVLNLLSPFLSLNATPTGQATLNGTLAGALALNRFAAANTGVAAVSISDKAIFGGTSTSITLLGAGTRALGPAANLAGGLPPQAIQTPGTIIPVQQYGGLGTLGGAFQAAVQPSGAAVPAAVTLLTTAYSFNGNDLGAAKNYFANGTTDGTTTAVAPAGIALPTANGYPNRLTSVYDTAFGVSNTQAGQGIYGDSRPVQVSTAFTAYDPTALTGLATNPAFPSGHTTYAFTDSVLVGMMVPQFYQSMLLRASEYGQSRNELGVHYTLDIIGSRALVQFNLAQMLTATDPAYLRTNVVSGSAAANFNTSFQQAASGLNAYLNTQTGVCGGSLAACAANNPYNTYSATTYGGQPYVANPGTGTDATNAAIYAGRLTQGLPTLSYAQAPREGAPGGAADASILLATVYGGSTAQAQALAASVGGPLYGNLSTSTINQVIVNTENVALAAFYGTALSYWTRINLYDAIGYFGNVVGTLNLASGDQVNRGVTVGATGVLGGSGTINGNLVVASGGALGLAGTGMPGAPLQVNGTTSLLAGSAVRVSGLVLPGQSYKIVNGTGAIAVAPGVGVDTSGGTGLVPTLGGTLVVAGDPGLSVVVRSSFASLAQTGNGRAVAAALDAGGNAGGYGPAGQGLLSTLIAGNTVATAPAAFALLGGEGIAGQQQMAFNATELVASTVLDVARNGLTADAVVQMGPRRIWGTGFGQTGTLDGDAAAGSAKWSSSVAGFAAGTDYRLENGLLLGIAGAYSGSQFTVRGRGTAGDAQAGHLALYALQRFGAAYVTGVFDAGFFGNNVNRGGFGAAQGGQFSATEVLGRVEGGYVVPLGPVTVTPYGGFQVAGLYNSSFREGGGAVNGALNVGGRSADSQKVYLGAQVDATRAFGGLTVTPYARVAWEHEFTTDRTINASFQALPGSSFTVSAAPAAEDAARVSAGAKLDFGRGVGAYAAFDGAFSGQGNTYGGKAGFRYSW